jgi:hypothetical protein
VGNHFSFAFLNKKLLTFSAEMLLLAMLQTKIEKDVTVDYYSKELSMVIRGRNPKWNLYAMIERA